MNEADALLELQEIDLAILRHEKKLESLPEKQSILKARAKIREVEDMHGKAELLVRRLEAEIKARQDEMDLLRSRIDEEQAKIMATSDHRQVQALTREMDGLRRRSDKLDMEAMQFLQRSEKAQSQVAAVEDALVKLRSQEAGLVDAFKDVGGRLQEQIADMQASRVATASRIAPDLVERYEAVRATHGGIGVGRLDGHACSACRMTLPAERVRDLSEGPDVGTCPQCRRLIIVRWSEQA